MNSHNNIFALPTSLRFLLETSSQILLAFNNTPFFQKAAKKESSVLRIPTRQKSILFQTIQRLEESFSSDGYANELYRQVLFLEFMIHLNRAAHARQLFFLDTAVYNEKIADILHYINANLSAHLSIDDLASRFYLSKYYMMRLFKSET